MRVIRIGKRKLRKILIISAIILAILVSLFILFYHKEYKVVFDSNGGTKISEVKIKGNERVSEPNDPTKEGYIFDGWYLDNKLYNFDSKVTKDIVLKAKWNKSDEEYLSFLLDEITLAPSKTSTLELDMNIKDNPKLKWSSSDEEIASVDDKGVVTAHKVGSTSINVETEDGKYKATIKVIVSEDIVKVTGVSISGNNEVEVEATIKLTASINPSNASNKIVTWKSSDTAIATVDSKGNVKGIKVGKVTITVTTEDGKKAAKKEITVKEKKVEDIAVEKVAINGDKKVAVGESIKLTAEITPNNATDKTVTWKSDNEDISKVDKDGNVSGIKAGTTKITVTSSNGKSASIDIEVVDNTPLAVEFTNTTKEVNVGETLQLTTKLEPNIEGATYEWQASNTNATVDNGVVTGKTAGKVTITVTVKANGKTATANIEITVKDEYKITLTKSDGNYTIKVTKNGENLDDYQSFTYKDKTINKSSSITENEIDKNVTSTKLKLSDGSEVDAKIEYSE